MMRQRKRLVLLAVLALSVSLLAGCGGQTGDVRSALEPVPAANEETESAKAPAPRPTEGDDQPEGGPEKSGPEEPEKDEPPAGGTAGEQQPDEPAPEPVEPAAKPEPVPAPAAEPEPEPAPEPEPEPEPGPEPEGENVMAGDTYMISVTLEGGSGRATVESPVKLHYEGWTCWATIIWSSPNFDYMKVDGQRYDPINSEGNSTFKIPVSAFDQPLTVIADTVAMSEPHEVEYILTFDSASMQDA
ncbi:MAG: hypothetical protein K2P26_05015 [Oscillospiraceae bacterium]|nr:hypothetical protein [Oscillospiraceae bacterium]